MPKQKKSLVKLSSVNKSTNPIRANTLQSSTLKARSPKKSSKIIKTQSSNDVDSNLQQQLQNSCLSTASKQGARPMTLSPQKQQHHMYKLDPSYVNQQVLEQNIRSPKLESQNEVHLLDSSFKDSRDRSQLANGQHTSTKNRPQTSGTNSVNVNQYSPPKDQDAKLVAVLASNGQKRLSGSGKAAQIAVVGQAQHISTQHQEYLTKLINVSSPGKSQHETSNHGSDNHLIDNSHVPSSVMYMSRDQQIKAMQANPALSFQHIINASMYRTEEKSAVGVNGLLNMSKQRGLISTQAGLVNVRNSSNSRSIPQATKGTVALQNSGRAIIQRGIVQHPFHSTNITMQQTLPLTINEMQFHNIAIPEHHSAPLNKQMIPKGNYHQLLAQQQGISINGLSQNPYQVKQPPQGFVGLGIGQAHQQILMAKKQGQQYFYYDWPVAINGRQMVAPSHPAKQDMSSIKKTVSAGSFPQSGYPDPQGLLIQYEQQLAHGDFIQQSILQELMEKQHIQVLQSQQMLVHDTHSDFNPSQLAKTAHTTKKVSKIPFANAYVEDCYKYIVVAGNNSGLIRKAMERRDWWIEIPAVHSMFNFKWQPVSYGIKFERLSPIKPKQGEIGGAVASQFNCETVNTGTDNVQTRQMVNHFEFHTLISEKQNLFNNMQRYFEGMKENIFDTCPITFYVEVSDVDKVAAYNQSVQPFVQFYQCLEENKTRIKQIQQQIAEMKQKQSSTSQEESTENSPRDKPTPGEKGTPKDTFLAQLNRTNPNQQSLPSSQPAQKLTKFRTFHFDKRSSTRHSMPLSHFDGYNLWLLKPTHLNRGRGIHVFRDLESFHKLVREYTQGKDEEVKTKQTSKQEEQQQQQDHKNNQVNANVDEQIIEGQQQHINKAASPKKVSNNYKIKHNTFIIQKYIEKPLLLFNRKFDIRQWVLVNHEYDVFFFKEGYLRTSSSEYTIDLQNIDNQFVHLTNNAVQKFAENYGGFEDGNQLSYDRFQEIIDMQYPGCGISVKNHIVPQMKEQIIKSMHAVRKTLDPYKRKHCFELFGYDFILDADFNVWLIEVNTNPCIEESSNILKIYLPRMIEDMLKLTIDMTFPKIKKRARAKGSPQKEKGDCPNKGPSVLDKIEEETVLNPEEQCSTSGPKKGSRIHPVPGYSDGENMWEKIWNLDKQDMPSNQYPNCRSEFNIHVRDKAFKIKRNAMYKAAIQKSESKVVEQV